jgi:DNA-binding response OmpR family regulator
VTAALLIVEDDPAIGLNLERALTNAGYACTRATSIEEARRIDDVPDLTLLDLGLPDGDGLDLAHEFHVRWPDVPVIMLTARAEEMDVVIGLDAGAVDYITKPFKLAELMARIRAQLRRTEPRSAARSSSGDLVLDRDARRAWLAGNELTLRVKEFDLLARLLTDAGSAVTRETLMADVWDDHWFGSTKTLDFHIAAIRRKIDSPGAESLITTLRGIGYRYELQ